MLHFHYGETEELICKSRDVDFFEQINVGYRRTEVKPGPFLLVPAFEQADIRLCFTKLRNYRQISTEIYTLTRG